MKSPKHFFSLLLRGRYRSPPKNPHLTGREQTACSVGRTGKARFRLYSRAISGDPSSYFFSKRKPKTHKGSYGHVLMIGGSKNKPGAILMAGRAALRTGSGLVTVALPDKAFRKIRPGFLELMYEPCLSSPVGTLSRKSWPQIKKLFKKIDVIGLGPGLGVNSETRALVSLILKNTPKIPKVIDADALNVIALDKKMLKGQANIVITPHPAEMARLVGSTTAKVQAHRAQVARDFASEYGVTVVLKGFRTVIASPRGQIFINTTGNPGMATAGMGDVLTGILTSLLGQGMEFSQAVVAGVYIHGRAGDRVAKRLGDRGLLASDVIDEIPLVMKELLS